MNRFLAVCARGLVATVLSIAIALGKQNALNTL